MFTLLLLFTFIIFTLQYNYCNAHLPEGFEDQGVGRVGDLVDVGFAIENDGTHLMFAITKKGTVYTITNFETDDDSNANEILALDIEDEVCNDGERGIGSIIAHPNFANNRYVYIFYTKKNLDDDVTDEDDENYGCIHDKTIGPRNTCSRFTLNDDLTIDKDSELVIFQTDHLHDKIHNGGDMAFGNDGMLYVVIGDAGERGMAYAQRTDNLFGTVVRVTETGEIPNDNPFLGDGTASCKDDGKTTEGTICQEIFAYGLRNPFRFTMNPHSLDKVQFYINDVGGKRWEETNIGGTDYAGVNYGWPIAEGPCDISSSTKCPVYEDFDDPIFWYEHNSEDQGAAVGIAIVPPNMNWPSRFQYPSFFFVDFVFGIIYVAEEDESNYCRDCTPPTPAYTFSEFHEFTRPVGLRFGPYKDTEALYYTTREGSLNIRRIVYKSAGNNAPEAIFTVDNTVVQIGDTVNFDASETSDPDPNDTLTYEWDFGDGSPKESGITVQHTYETGGTYIAKLHVSDSQDFTDNYEIEISVGVLPTVEILSPDEGAMFAVGDFFTLRGSGTDGEGNPLDPDKLEWEVRQHHGAHHHPFTLETGESIMIGPAPEPEDFLAATNSYLEIRLTGYDSIGLHSTVTRSILPKSVWLDFDSVPTGMIISLDEEILVLPQRVLSWENHNLRVLVPDQDDDYVFSNWSNGEGREHTINVPAATSDVPKFVVTFQLSSESSPSPSPTEESTEEPSTGTLSPTENPTREPSPSPTTDPTAEPSPGTLSPTNNPTREPANDTTNQPSPSPTEEPTMEPSQSPTDDSEQTTRRPEENPTGTPTLSPTLEPETELPTTSSPTGSPFSSFTTEPSLEPTKSPSSYPIGMPTTQSPSDYPSAIPSNLPSAIPSDLPSVIPSFSPSDIPSGQPSGMPSLDQSLSPTTTSPTLVPTEPPSSVEVVPSDQPFSIPTTMPTIRQTNTNSPVAGTENNSIRSSETSGTMVISLTTIFVLIISLMIN